MLLRPRLDPVNPVDKLYDDIINKIPNDTTKSITLEYPLPRRWGKTTLALRLLDNIPNSIMMVSNNIRDYILRNYKFNKKDKLFKITDVKYYYGVNIDLVIYDEIVPQTHELYYKAYNYIYLYTPIKYIHY